MLEKGKFHLFVGGLDEKEGQINHTGRTRDDCTNFKGNPFSNHTEPSCYNFSTPLPHVTVYSRDVCACVFCIYVGICNMPELEMKKSFRHNKCTISFSFKVDLALNISGMPSRSLDFAEQQLKMLTSYSKRM